LLHDPTTNTLTVIQNIYNKNFPKNTTLLLPDMVVLEMVHEVSAVSFHLLIARHRAEHNLGETFAEKARTLKLFPFAQLKNPI
jgi:hypothetical protein